MSERQNPKQQSSRGGKVFIGAWVPQSTAQAVDVAVKLMDLDRSKFLRRALQEKIAGGGHGGSK